MKLNARHFSLVATLAVVGAVGVVATGCPAPTPEGGYKDPYESRLEILSVRGNPDFVQTIEGAPRPRYYAPTIVGAPPSEGFERGEYQPENPEDPFFRDSYVAEVDGNIGEFGLTFENLDPKRMIESVFAVYIVEDLSKIAFPIPIRIADNLMMDYRDMSWGRNMQPMVFDLWNMYPYPFTNIANNYSGVLYQAKFIDMDPAKRWDNYAVFAAKPGLKVRVSAFGSLSDGTIVTTKPGHELTLYLKPQNDNSGVAAKISTPRTLTTRQKNAVCADAATQSNERIKCKNLKGQFGCVNSMDDATAASIPDFCKTN